jgi:Cu/Zn superoxide dismutase
MHAYLHASLTLSLIIGLSIVITTTTVNSITSAKAQFHGFSIPAAVTATAITGPSSSPSSGKQFSARLTGDNEVPPVNKDATGRIRITVNSQQDALDYQLSLSSLKGVVTGAHIHKGSGGTNGPVVANLNIAGASAAASASAGGSAMTSTSTGGTITSADLKGPLSGKQISDLIRLIEDGKAYVNVHTDQNPDGEIRGQLAPSANQEVDNSSTSTGASATASTSPSASASATAP